MSDEITEILANYDGETYEDLKVEISDGFMGETGDLIREHAQFVVALRETRARLAEAQATIARVEAEIHHADDNEHRLDPMCQGVAFGEVVPAVRIDHLWAALAAAGPSAPEPESRQWLTDGPDTTAHAIVAWVNASGGEAQYNPDLRHIEIRSKTISGFTCAYPGDTVQMTDEWFSADRKDSASPATSWDRFRAFRVVSEPSADPKEGQ